MRCSEECHRSALPAGSPSAVRFDRPQKDLPFLALIAGAVVSLIVVAVLMFSTPHASYAGYYYPNGVENGYAEQTQVGSCITAWDEMAGSFNTTETYSTEVQQLNEGALNPACSGVIHGRQHVPILFLIVALGLCIAAVFRRRSVTQRRQAAFQPEPTEPERWLVQTGSSGFQRASWGDYRWG